VINAAERADGGAPAVPRTGRRALRGAGVGGARSWFGPSQPFWGFLFVLPILVLFGAFKFWPIVYAIGLSFTNTSPVSHTSDFVGIDNYLSLVRDPQFLRATTITAYYVFGTVVPVVLISLGIALLLNERIRLRGLYRVALFFPAIIPIIVVPILWQFLFHPYGLVNTAVAENMGLGTVKWLTSSNSVIPAYIIATSWRIVPLCIVIFLAGLQNIPEELFDAAKVDGASMVQRFRYVTIPRLKPTILVVVVFAITLTAKNLVFMLVMTNGGPNNASRTLSLYIYELGFRFSRVGYASAVAVVLLILIVIMTVISLRLFRSEE
jgi:ABC-type sugar transport system permease subunit